MDDAIVATHPMIQVRSSGSPDCFRDRSLPNSRCAVPAFTDE